MSADSTKKTILVALGVCLVCSVLVSTAAVALESIQSRNKKLDKIQNILQAGDIDYKDKNVEDIYSEQIKPVIIDLKSGALIEENNYSDVLNPEFFDIKRLASDPDYGMLIAAEDDIAQIKKRPKYMVVYEVLNDKNEISKYIFPIYGFGLWSTLYGFVAISDDMQTIQGLTFYEHGETPGLGGEVDNQRWKNSWKGKQAFDENGEVIIEVIKGIVDPASSKSGHQIDGLSGATITTRGVDQLVKYWLGHDGYGHFIETLRKEGADEKV